MFRKILFTFVGLALTVFLSACGTSKATDSNSPVTVNITLKEFSVESSVTEFKAGVQYHFVVTNAGSVPHEFMLMPVAMDSMGMSDFSNMSMEQKDAMALMMIPQEQLSTGATVEKDYTFNSVPQGNIEMVCTLPGHFEAGMKLPINIK